MSNFTTDKGTAMVSIEITERENRGRVMTINEAIELVNKSGLLSYELPPVPDDILRMREPYAKVNDEVNGD